MALKVSAWRWGVVEESQKIRYSADKIGWSLNISFPHRASMWICGIPLSRGCIIQASPFYMAIGVGHEKIEKGKKRDVTT